MTEHSTGDGPAIAFLASEYEQVVARDGVLMQTTFTVVGIAATVMGGIAFVVPDYEPSGEGVAGNKLVFLGLPLAPTLLFGLLVYLTFHINFVAQYSHALEAHMAKVAGHRLSDDELRVPGLSTESPALMRLGGRMFTPGNRPATQLYSASLVAVLIGVGGLLLVVPVLKLRGMAPGYQVAALLIYLPPNLALLAALLRSWRPNRGLLRDTLVDVAGSGTAANPAGQRRSLWSYLLVPRTVDHLVKVLIAIVGTLLGRLALSERQDAGFWDWDTLGVVALVVVVLEYLLYQSRYTWNDLRDLSHDRRHGRSVERRRIPLPISRREFGWVWLSIPVKHVAAFVLVGLLAPQQLLRFAVAAAGIWLSALVYEWLRTKSRQHIEKKTTPANKAPDLFDSVAVRYSRAVCLVIGAGYAVRIGTAVEVGANGSVPFAVIVLLGATMWLSEVSTVAMSWTLEGTELVHGVASPPADGTANAARRPEAGTEHARPETSAPQPKPDMKTVRADCYDPLLPTKAHIAYLLRSTGLIDAETAPCKRGTAEPPSEEKQPQCERHERCKRCGRGGLDCPRLVYMVRRHEAIEAAAKLPLYRQQGFLTKRSKWCSVWSLSGAIGFVLAALAAMAAASALRFPGAHLAAWAALAALPAVLQSLWAARSPTGFGITTLALGVLASQSELRYPLLAPVLFLTLAGVFHVTRSSSYALVVGWIDGISAIAARVAAFVSCIAWTVAQWLAGDGTWDHLDAEMRKPNQQIPKTEPFVRWDETPHPKAG